MDAPTATTGDEYRYLLHGPGGPQSRIDPYARQVTNSVGNGVIYDPTAFDWGNEGFHAATGNELVIYELYVGTFNVAQAGRPGMFDSASEKSWHPDTEAWPENRDGLSCSGRISIGPYTVVIFSQDE